MARLEAIFLVIVSASLCGAEDSEKKLKVTLQQLNEDYAAIHAYTLEQIHAEISQYGREQGRTLHYAKPSDIFTHAILGVKYHEWGKNGKIRIPTTQHITLFRYVEELIRPHYAKLNEPFEQMARELLSAELTWRWFHGYFQSYGFKEPFLTCRETLIQQAKEQSEKPAPRVTSSLAVAVASAGPAARSEEEQPGMPKPSAPQSEKPAGAGGE